MAPTLVLTDGEARISAIDDRAVPTLMPLFEAASVSRCPQCRSGVLAALAVLDGLDAAPPLEAVTHIRDLIDEAPTLHIYMVDHGAGCSHRAWRDPGFEEWCDAVESVNLV
ncbi:MAG: hypothetical protein ACOYN3_01450 [Acidimicrobiia bacterium]